MFKKLLLIIVLTFIMPIVQGAPSLNSALVSNDQISITGSQFGSSPIPGIIAYDNFDSYTVNSEVPATPLVGSWNRFTPAGAPWYITALIDDTYSRSGSSSMWGHQGIQDWSGVWVGDFSAINDLYVSYWFRFNMQPGVGQVKLLQLKGNQQGSCAYYHPEISTAWVDGWSSYVIADEAPCEIVPWNGNYYSGSISQNDWNFFEAAFTQSSPNIANGMVLFRVNGISEFDYSNIVTRRLSNSEWTHIEMLNGMTNTNDANTWIDDLYVARSFARVLLCNNSVYSSADECYLQFPNSWTSSSISVDLNFGAFTQADIDNGLYLFVIDENNVASQGLLLETQPICEAIIGNCYYIAPNGNDANDGSFENPYASTNPIVNILGPGDHVYFRGGSYTAQAAGQEYSQYNNHKAVLRLYERSGTPQDPIVIKAYPGEYPVIDMYNINPTFDPLSYADPGPPDGYIGSPDNAFDLKWSNNVVIEGFEIIHGSIYVYGSNNTWIQNNHIHHLYSDRDNNGLIVLYFTNNAYVNNNILHDTYSRSVNIDGVWQFNSMHDNQDAQHNGCITTLSGDGYNGYGTETSGYFEIFNNSIYDCPVMLFFKNPQGQIQNENGWNIELRDNHFHGQGLLSWWFNAANVLFENNLFEGTGPILGMGGSESVAPNELLNEIRARNVVFKNNVFTGIGDRIVGFRGLGYRVANGVYSTAYEDKFKFYNNVVILNEATTPGTMGWSQAGTPFGNRYDSMVDNVATAIPSKILSRIDSTNNCYINPQGNNIAFFKRWRLNTDDTWLIDGVSIQDAINLYGINGQGDLFPSDTNINTHFTDPTNTDYSIKQTSPCASIQNVGLTHPEYFFNSQPPPPVCGNNVREGDEVCDGSDLAGNLCADLGYNGGTLACNSECTGYDTNQCTTNQQPSDCSNPNYVFCDDFESGDFSVYDDYDGNPSPDNVIVTDPGYFNTPGNLVARLRSPSGQRGTADIVKVLESQHDKLYMRWYQKYEPGFDFTSPNHGGGLFAGDRNSLGNAGGRPVNAELVSLGFEHTASDPSRNAFYAYYVDMYQDCGFGGDPNACYGDVFPCTTDEGSSYCTNPDHRDPSVGPALQNDQWYCFEIMLDLGTPTPSATGASGAFNFWVDEQEIGPWQNLWLRQDNLQINIAHLALFNHLDTHSDEGIMVDDFIVSTERIGCFGSVPDPVCGDNVCDAGEAISCPQDCFIPDPTEIIIDNGQTGTSKTGTWYTGGSSFAGFYGTDYEYSSNDAGNTYNWQTSLAPGNYEIGFSWSTNAGRPNDNTLNIYVDGVLVDTQNNNQQVSDNGFYSLGTFPITSNARIELIGSNSTEGTSADAVRFTKTSDIVVGPTFDLDNDGDIDLEDLYELATNFGQQYTQGDYDYDNKITIIDIVTHINNWG